MTNREKLLSTLHYEQGPELPVVHFGYWDETILKWTEEGHIKEGESVETVSRRLGFDFEYAASVCYNGPINRLYPPFAEEVIQELPDGSKHIRNGEGVIELRKPGLVSIPAEIGHTLVDRKSWEAEYLPRLQFSEERVNAGEIKKYADSRGGNHIGLYAGSLYGCIRNWFGIVELSYVAAEDEDLYDEIINTVAGLEYRRVKLCLETAEKNGVQFDIMHFWEDICFNHGPLVNPAVFAEKIGPHYKRITDLGRAHGIDIFSLDCDGKIDALIPVWLENGVNTMFPIEVGTWNACIAPWREKHGKGILGIGGMDKRVFAHDRAAVDAEIERLKPLAAMGGYVPCPDHRIPPDAKWETVQYYCEKIRKDLSPLRGDFDLRVR